MTDDQHGDRLFDELLASLRAETDLADRLRSLRTTLENVDRFLEELRALRSSTILELRELEWEWSPIGELLGVSGQRAGQLATTNTNSRSQA